MALSKRGAVGSEVYDMPHDSDAEKAVLAAALLQPDAATELVAALDDRCFFQPRNKVIFEAVCELDKAGKAVDVYSVTDALRSSGKIDAAGGEVYIAGDLLSCSYGLGNWQDHAELLKRLSLQRALVWCAGQLKGLAVNPPLSIEELKDEAEKLLAAAIEGTATSKGARVLGDLAVEGWNRYAELGKEPKGVATGLKDLDEVIGNLQPGDLAILGARPSLGKSALALDIAMGPALEGYRVYVVSLEMPDSQVFDRLVSKASIGSQQGPVPAWRLSSGSKLGSADYARALFGCEKLSGLDMWIADNPAMTVQGIKAEARRLMRDVEPGKGIVIVDYLQLLNSESKYRENRQIEVAEMSRALKLMAKELNVPVLALSQLSRAADAREGKVPMLADLRESGAIEQDADIVLLLDRSRNTEEAARENRPNWGMANLYVAKNRRGRLGKVELKFDAETMTFGNITRGAATFASAYGGGYGEGYDPAFDD